MADPRFAGARAGLVFFAGLGGALVVVITGATIFWRLTRDPDATTNNIHLAVSPPAPRLQPTPAADLAAQRAEERALAESYGWIDEAAGIARIPVKEAMRLVVERGAAAMEPEGQP